MIMLSHVQGLNQYVSWYIANVNTSPLFFFLSGYLLSENRIHENFYQFAKKQFSSLIVPYLTFWLISYLIWLPAHRLAQRSAPLGDLAFIDPFFGLLYGTANHLYPNVVLWFFPCLFVTSILFFWANRAFGKTSWLCPVILTLIGLAVALFDNQPVTRWPWNADIAFIAAIFFGLGYYLKKRAILESTLFNSPLFNIVIFVVSFALLLIIAGTNGPVSIVRMSFNNPFLYLLTEVIAIWSMISIAHVIPGNGLCEWIARNTILIFPLHTLFYSIFTGIGVVGFKLPYDFKEQPYFTLLYVAAAMALCVPAKFMFNRFAPALIGLKRQRQV
jgi:acyltransferase